MSTTDFGTTFTSVKTTFTFTEAIEYMKLRDRNPTTNNIVWFDSKTKKRVSIGYADGL